MNELYETPIKYEKSGVYGESSTSGKTTLANLGSQWRITREELNEFIEHAKR